MSQTKETNPKDAIGSGKAPLSCIPGQVLYEIGLGLLDGALKYRRHNWRVAGVRASVYFDAAQRHLWGYWEGQDIDPDSGLHHVTKAITSLLVLRDAMLQDKLTDDRPPSDVNAEVWLSRANGRAYGLVARAKQTAGRLLEPYVIGAKGTK